MKKLFFIVSIFIVIGLALPLVGNKVINEEIQNRLDVLTSYGVKVEDTKVDSSYLVTSRHYEFKVVDSDKFITYISQFSEAQLPPYTKSLLDGIRVGTDLKYSNFPFKDAMSIDIYPLSLSTPISKEIAKQDKDFLSFLTKIFKTKGFLYHLNYAVIDTHFDGYIKDFDESFRFKDGVEIKMAFNGSTFSGLGPILAPTSNKMKISNIVISSKDKLKQTTLSISDITLNSNFSSASTYSYDFYIGGFNLKNDGIYSKGIFDLSNFKLFVSSDTTTADAHISSKISFENLDVKSKTEFVNLQNFNYDISLDKLKKDSYKEIRTLLMKSKLSKTKKLDVKLEKALVDIIANGLEFKISDFSVKKISYLTFKNIDGFSVKTDFSIKKDLDFINKYKKNKDYILKNIDIKTTLKLSKDMFNALTKVAPMSVMAKGFAKEDGTNLVFDFSFVKGELLLNGKKLR